jgi:hypothetical protein
LIFLAYIIFNIAMVNKKCMMCRYLTAIFLLFALNPLNAILEKEKPVVNELQVPPGLDYSIMAYWAAHPFKHDPSDSVPDFLKNETRDSSVDVFFLHPTTYTSHFTGWNAKINDIDLNKQTDYSTILFQASVFNGSCRVFAPRYRQAHLRVFFTRDTLEAKKALDLAYQDLKNAFRYYLDHWNHGRPIIIASHSQGTRHAILLLKEFFDGKPLQKQLVCAYLAGYQVKKDDFKFIPAGDSARQTGCVVGWRTYRSGYIPKFVKKENGNCICTNPVTWNKTNEWSDKNLHPGFIAREFNELQYPHVISASIAQGANVLWIALPSNLRRRYPIRNFHIGDYNLFYINIRKNIKDRVEAWQRR